VRILHPIRIKLTCEGVPVAYLSTASSSSFKLQPQHCSSFFIVCGVIFCVYTILLWIREVQVPATPPFFPGAFTGNRL
jgi:hypothetical protein